MRFRGGREGKKAKRRNERARREKTKGGARERCEREGWSVGEREDEKGGGKLVFQADKNVNLKIRR